MDKRNDVWLCLKVKDQNDNMSKTTVVKINDHEFISKKRYQQLEQVAKEMWSLIRGIEREYPRLLNPNCKPGGQLVYPTPSEDFRKQLEALGAILDDQAS